MRPLVLLAGLSGMMAVGMGAYAAHGLAGDVFMQALAERGSHYQLVHALALLAADRLAADLKSQGIEVETARAVLPSLEDIFIARIQATESAAPVEE